MTNSEAIRYLENIDLKERIEFNQCKHNQYYEDNLYDSLALATEALKKAEKYKWHDLRENPEDLPGENDFCVIKTLYNSRIGYDICIYNPNDYLCWESVLTDYSNSVTYAVAWVAFDPFEGVIE